MYHFLCVLKGSECLPVVGAHAEKERRTHKHSRAGFLEERDPAGKGRPLVPPGCISKLKPSILRFCCGTILLHRRLTVVAVHLRLTRGGRHKRPFYRVVAVDSRAPRDGKYIEILGTHDPLKDPAVTTLKSDRVLDWLRKGAQPSVTVRTLLRRSGILTTFEESKKQTNA